MRLLPQWLWLAMLTAALPAWGAPEDQSSAPFKPTTTPARPAPAGAIQLQPPFKPMQTPSVSPSKPAATPSPPVPTAAKSGTRQTQPLPGPAKPGPIQDQPLAAPALALPQPGKSPTIPTFSRPASTAKPALAPAKPAATTPQSSPAGIAPGAAAKPSPAMLKAEPKPVAVPAPKTLIPAKPAVQSAPKPDPGAPNPTFVIPPRAAAPVPTQATLLGQIRNEQGDPIAEATVSLGKHSARTDASGSYLIEKLTPGRWEVKIQHPLYTEKQTRIWLVEGLKTTLSLALPRSVARQEPTRVGLLGVGSLPVTDTLAQRLAEELVRTGAFPKVGPLTFLKRDEVMPIVRKIDRPLHEILDRDRPDTALVKAFFEYAGVTALAIARVDMLTRNEGNASQLNSRSQIELWQLKDNRVEIRTLAEAGRSERQDSALSKAEADQLYAVQITQQADEVKNRWERDNPLAAFTADIQAPSAGQKIDTKVEILPKNQSAPPSQPPPPAQEKPKN
ncbi:carboxypeptidase-like regulatory domain-containing protein [Gloeobacter violaceus]|uniref:Gll1733 protein n=1 Tax=Gloeobacter violaceus (strain ATCC 29082 / PCC 7421) TaxID=251221 RepID=Q7NJU9_GLOVI|nr:carboxypeptidase-like regulatory domain-containing protein [Gloeobacter violaceus]BAC89674.1 gll1733 [Gloeobacter violaceus PCC 7421]